ncbi:MAG TPA: type II toxin-antitoxin system VapC family toxin [Blastocatellia bacterium]
MNLYVLDTDHLSLYQRGNPSITSHLTQVPRQQVAMAIITAEELVRGRLAKIRAVRDEAERQLAYQQFRITLGLIGAFQVLAYDDSASAIYESLRQQKLRVGTQNLRIAAITLAVGATLITRNSGDFGQVEGLCLEDWTK